MKLHFIIPVRHPENVRDPAEQRLAHEATFRSIAAQQEGDWHATVVVNRGQVLPALPPRFGIEEVTFPKNTVARNARTLEEFHHEFRADKGRRVAAALRHVDPDDYVMVVDDDDLVSRRLAGFVLSQQRQTGWYIAKGYSWRAGSRWMLRMPRFHAVCGSSLILPARYFAWMTAGTLPEEEAIRELGSHKRIFERLPIEGPLFRALPFRGAVYRLGHANANQRDVERIAAAAAPRPPNGGAAAPRMAGRAVDALRRGARFLVAAEPLTARLRIEFFGERPPADTLSMGQAPRHARSR